MENTQLETISPIETALAKENITNQVIEKLKADYSGLKINGIDDKAGFKAVEDARKHCKQLRVLAVNICKSGREDALKTQKDWISKEKEIVAAIEVTENYLSAQSEAIKEEEKRILFEAAQKAKLPLRKERLMTIGVEVPDEKLLTINDADFDALFNDLHSKVLEEKAAALKAEEKRIADEQEAERKRIEAEAKAEQEKIKAAEIEKQRIENERLKIENEAKEKALAEERAKAKAIQDEQDAIIAANKKKADEEAAKQKAIADLKIKQEREAKEKAEAELKAAKEAKTKELADIEAAKEAELHKGDAAKILDLIADLEALKTKYTFKGAKNKSMYVNVGELITKTITYITK